MKKLFVAITVTTLTFNNMCAASSAGEYRTERKGISLAAEEELTAHDVYAYLRDQIVVIVTCKEQKVIKALTDVSALNEQHVWFTPAPFSGDRLQLFTEPNQWEQARLDRYLFNICREAYGDKSNE